MCASPAAIPKEERLIRLDLGTLQWKRLHVRNKPVTYPDTPAAALAGGIFSGGVQMTPFGIRPCAKFDIVCLAEPPLDAADEAEMQAEMDADPTAGAQTEAIWEGGAKRPGAQPSGSAGAADDDNEEDDDGLSDDFVLVAIQMEGSVRHVRMPRAMYEAMRALHEDNSEDEAGDEDNGGGEAGDEDNGEGGAGDEHGDK